MGNMALAKQAALADGRFSKTVKDLAAARKQATAQVKQLRQDFSVGLVAVTAESKRVNTRITGQISVVSGEVQTLKSNQITVNNRVKRELAEIRRVSNVRFSEAKRAQRATQKLTGVASNINKANKAARKNIRAQTSAMQADMGKRIVSAITTGEALGKAIQQRLSSNLKSTVRSMRVELAEGLDRAADRVLRTVSGKRHKMADNCLSLKAYSVAAVDKVIDYTAKGKGRNLSSIGDLVQTIGALGAAHAVKAQGLGMGGNKIRSVFSAKTIKVSNSLAAVNGLVNEYAGSCKLVRARWPMGLGKYLMDKLEVSMLSKGVLQVDKISGKKGNYVYINGRSVGLSNKLNDFASLAAKMS